MPIQNIQELGAKMQEKDRQLAMQNKLRKKLEKDQKKHVELVETNKNTDPDKFDAKTVQTIKELISTQSKNKPSPYSTTAGGNKTFLKVEKSLELKKEAEILLNDARTLFDQNDLVNSQKKLTESILKADQCHDINCAFSGRKILICIALFRFDLETASMLALTLHENLNSQSFKAQYNSEIKSNLGITLNENDLSDIYLSLALSFILQGNFEQSLSYYQKITKVMEPRNKHYSALKETLSFLTPFYKELKAKTKMSKNLQDISAIFTLIEEKCIAYIEAFQYQPFYELLKQLLVSGAFFSGFNFKNKTSELAKTYLALKNNLIEINLHLSESLYQKSKALYQTSVNDEDKKSSEKFIQWFLALIKTVLKEALENKQPQLTFQSSSLLTEYFASLLQMTDLDSEAYNKIEAKYKEYFTIRNTAAKALEKMKPKVKEEESTPQEENSNTTSPQTDQPTEESVEDLEYKKWQDEYNQVAGAITKAQPEEVIKRFDSLFEKYTALHQTAQINFGKAECYNFDAQNSVSLINKLEKDLTALSSISIECRKEIWNDLENTFLLLSPKMDEIIQSLEYAVEHLKITTENCEQIINTKHDLNRQVNSDIKKMLSESKILSTQMNTYGDTVHKVIQGFINEMYEKKEFLIQNNLYGTKNNQKGTGALVNASIQQDTKLNTLVQKSSKVEANTSKLVGYAAIKEKSLGHWYKLLGDEKHMAKEYNMAYTHYLQASVEFKKNQKYQSDYALTERLLAGVKTFNVDLTENLPKKKELILQSIEHLKQALSAYISCNKSPNFFNIFGEHINNLQNEISEKEEYVRQLDQKLTASQNQKGRK